MKALSVQQPWADLIRSKIKTLEIRKWSTEYRGDLLICASKSFDAGKFIRMGVTVLEAEEKFPTGVAICVVRLVNARPYRNTPEDYRASGGVIWRKGLVALELADHYDVAPVPVRGQLGLFNAPVDFTRKAAAPAPACQVTPGCPGAGMDGDGRDAACGCRP